jgi:hypothetical protein
VTRDRDFIFMYWKIETIKHIKDDISRPDSIGIKDNFKKFV